MLLRPIILYVIQESIFNITLYPSFAPLAQSRTSARRFHLCHLFPLLLILLYPLCSLPLYLLAVGEHSSHSSCPGDRLPHGTAEKKHQEEENKGGIRRQAAAAAAAEADALAARHRSLVQRRRRMRSALRVLHVSEEAKVLLQSPEPVGQRGSRADEVIKVF